MKFFQKDPFGESVQRMEENELYEIVTKEVMNEEVVAGIWGRAFSDTEGDEQKAKALYINYRVQDLKDRATVIEGLNRHAKHQEDKQSLGMNKNRRQHVSPNGNEKSGPQSENEGMLPQVLFGETNDREVMQWRYVIGIGISILVGVLIAYSHSG
jgi:hypothetical protein